MKIIGESEHTFIVEASRTEIARLIGFYHQSTEGAPRLRVGLEILVSAMYDRLYSLERNKGDLVRMAKQLRAQADLLELTEPFIQQSTEAQEAA